MTFKILSSFPKRKNCLYAPSGELPRGQVRRTEGKLPVFYLYLFPKGMNGSLLFLKANLVGNTQFRLCLSNSLAEVYFGP
jgi:hypothetical protein